MPIKNTFRPGRRRFLQRCAITAASAIALPAFIPRHVLGSANQAGANQQIVVGIIGMGVRGDQLVLVNVEIPSKLTKEQRELFERLAETLGTTVRPREKGFLDWLNETLGG